MGDETMRLSTMQESAASAADIQKPLSTHSILAGARIEEANMIRNNKLPIRPFQVMEQPRESAFQNRFVRPPIFRGIKLGERWFFRERIQIDARTRIASKQVECSTRQTE